MAPHNTDGGLVSQLIPATWEGIRTCRSILQASLGGQLSEQRLEDLVLAAHEAAAMLIVHTEGGTHERMLGVTLRASESDIEVDLTVPRPWQPGVDENEGLAHELMLNGADRVAIDTTDGRVSIELTVRR